MSKNSNNVKKMCTLLSKIATIFTSSCYIIKTGYILTKDIEKPYMMQLNDEWIEVFEDIFGKFSMIEIISIKILKKSLVGPKEGDDIETFPKFEDQYRVATTREIDEIKNIISERIANISSCSSWESFMLSDDTEENEKLIRSLFADNNYIRFKPKDNEDSPYIILTKSLIPLVTEKNYKDLYYSSMKKPNDLYMIIFDFQFSMFRLYMFHYYIAFKDNKDYEERV